jgi:hypothetical protein
MQDFYKEVDENININRTFSIDDISDEDKLNRFYIVGEEVKIENILEDSEFANELNEPNQDAIPEPVAIVTIPDPSNNSIVIEPSCGKTGDVQTSILQTTNQ